MPTYDRATALIVVDVQNDFVDPNGGLSVAEAEATLPVINDEVARAAQAGGLVVYTQDWHPADTSHFQKDGGIWPVHCVQGTWGAQLHPALDVRGDVVQKGAAGDDAYSGFTQRNPTTGVESATDLETLLRRRAIERAVIVGIAADVCVKATALDAIRLGFATSVIRDATRGVDLQPGDTARAFDELQAAGATIE